MYKPKPSSIKLIFVTIAIIYLIACKSSDEGNAIRPQEMDTVSVVEDLPVFKGINHRFYDDNYNTYSNNTGILSGVMGNYDTTYMAGAWYISAKGENGTNIRIANPQETIILSGRKFFVEYIPELKSTRITNYKGTVTILDHNDKFKLKANHTVIIDNKGNYKKFRNEDAAADTLWLTSSLVGLGNIGLATLIYRMADRYDCTVQFNALLNRPLATEDVTGDFDCKENLAEGLKMLQSVFYGDDSLQFSYSIKDKVVYIDQ